MMMIMTFGRDLSEWPVGPGQLTARGKRMHFHLGQVTFISIVIMLGLLMVVNKLFH